MADGDYERRAARDAELKRLERILKEKRRMLLAHFPDQNRRPEVNCAPYVLREVMEDLT